jgi:photosystem II stability/assembly factor-like uncharacterized protein
MSDELATAFADLGARLSDGTPIPPAHEVFRRGRRRVVVRSAAPVAVVLLLIGAVLVPVLLRSGDSASPPSHRPTRVPASGPVTRALLLDDSHVLLEGPERWESMDTSGDRTQLTPLPGSPGLVVQVLGWHGDLLALTSDCQTEGLQVFRSHDRGQNWSRGQQLGFVNCSGGSYGRLFVVGPELVLITHEDDAPETSASTSTDGVHWRPLSPQLSTIASYLTFGAGGSYVGVASYRPDGRYIGYGDHLGGPERTTDLPGNARPVNSTLITAGSTYAVLSADGRAYSSATGASWELLGTVIPGCASCASWSLTAVSADTWWARIVDGRRSRYARTTDAGRHWVEMPGPPAPQAAVYDDALLGWDASSAIVVRSRHVWLTRDRGETWTRP